MILFSEFFKYRLPFPSILIFAFLHLLAVLISPTVLLTKSFSKNPSFVKCSVASESAIKLILLIVSFNSELLPVKFAFG